MPPDARATLVGSSQAGASWRSVLGSGAQAPAEWWRPAPQSRPDGRSASPASGPASPVPFWSLMAFTGVLIFAPQAYVPALAPMRPALLVIGAGIVAYLLDCWARRAPLVQWTRPLKLIAALILWAVATVPFSLWPGGSIGVLLDLYLKTVTIFWLLSHVVDTAERMRRVAWGLTWMAVGLGLIAVYNALTGASAGTGLYADRVRGNEGSLTKNPNDLALMINLIVPLTVGLLLSAAKGWQRNLLMAAIAAEIVTVVLSGSRGGALTLGVIVLLYLWKLRRRRERTWLWGVMVAGILVLPMAPASYFERLSTITDVEADRTGSAQERWSDMMVAVKRIVANPVIGAGLGMNTLAMNEARGGGWLPVHNVYLEHALDLGLPGVVLFVLLWKACVRATVDAQHAYERLGWADMRLVAEGLQISLIAYATAAMFHPVSYHAYFYYMAGLAVAAERIGAARSTRENAP